MVLSNKKLKEKLRKERSDSLISSESKPSATTTPFSSTNPKSLTQLLGAAAHKPRLSKREKRRINAPLNTPSSLKDGENGGIRELEDSKSNGRISINGGDGEVRVESGKKKRKRDEVDGKGDLKEGSDLKKEENKNKKKKKKKKKAKKKKTEKKIENQENVEPGEGLQLVNESKEDQIAVQKDEISVGQVNEEVSKKVYVGGIPYYSTEDDIRSFFDHCGTITEIDCMKFPETGKFRGIAILSFKTEEAAKRAIALDGSDMGGFFLKIQRYNKTTPQVSKTPAFTPPVIQGYNRIYAGNLSWDITEDDLKNLFSDCSISSIRFGEDKVTGEFKGYAHVDFSDNASLEKALKLDQEIVCGRPVRITCAVALRKPQSQKPTSKAVDNNKQSTSQDTVDNKQCTPQVAVDNKQFTPQFAVDNKQSTPQVDVDVDDKQSIPQVAVENVPTVSTGKMRRRNCYLCGERGHISSACPKQAAQQANPNTD